MFTKCLNEKEVKKEVKPASWLEVKEEVKLFELDNTARSQTVVHEQSSFTPSTKCFTPNSKSFTPSFTPHFFNTELCIDLKTILTSDRRAKMRKDYRGVLTRDGREHFTFIEDAQEMKRAAVVSRNPLVYAGACINVHRRDDGSLYPTFRQPQLSTFYTFKDFCREAAEELLMMAGLGEEE